MFDDIELNNDPSFGFLLLTWGGTLTIVKWTGLVLSYINSKTPAQKTTMDFASVCFLKLILLAKLISTCLATITTILTDSGEIVALTCSWMMFLLGHTILLAFLLLVTLQLLYTMYPWLLGSSAFETFVKCAVVIVFPTMSLTSAFVFAYCFGYKVPPVIYNLLRGQVVIQFDSSKGNFIFRAGALSLVVLYSTLVQLFIKI